MARKILKAMVVLIAFTLSCSLQKHYDVVIRNATIYDGSGGAPYAGGVAIRGEKIVAVGDVSDAKGDTEVDAEGLAVAPGFINMLSWATTSLLIDGKSQSDIRQGVTLEVFGEGWSEGPLSEKMKQEILENQGEFKYNIEWTTLGEYLDYLVEKGISTNIASFIGATTVRIHELGEEDRPPAPEELERMRELVHTAMQEGALGLGTSLIYTPAFYAKTDELIELSKVASEYGGMYISHMRSEGNQLLEALDELLTIAREANIPAEIYHLKAAGKENWGKLDDVIAKIEAARADGLKITADMYNYIAGATGLDASMPPWVQEGGFDKWRERLMDDAIRKKIKKEMVEKTDEWENLGLAAGPEGMLLVGFKSDSLKPLTGKSLAEIAQMRGKSPQDVMIDLVIEDGSRVETVYFLMSEENVKRQIALPWMTFCSDAGSLAPEGLFLKRNPHPRAYGNFSRLLGKYVREEKVIPLEEAIKRLTSMPAENLRIRERGKLEKGYFADVVIFDPEKIQDHATFEKPHLYSTGMQHVFVNGRQVLKNGEHTGATPGQVVRGPGWTGWK